ncbi:MAG: aromatic ring-hydroxylating dioxygenase subunit alpha [Vulcanimicrobiota bacterium]
MSKIDAFNPELPLTEAPTPPASWYTDADIFELERKGVFGRAWQYVGHTGQVQDPGDYFADRFLGEPYVVVRGEDGQLRAFYNVCRHHAACVATGQGNTDLLVCPYHGWAYRLDGSLRRAPRLGQVENFEPDKFGLVPLPLEQWGPLLFAHFGTPERSFAEEMAGLEQHLDPSDLATLKFVRRESYELACNWKVFVDNYLDGGYHVEYLHKGLAGQLDLKNYSTKLYDRFSIQACGSSVADDSEGVDFAERLGGGAAYAWLYPNLMLNRYGPIMDLNWVVPLAPDRCLTIFDYWFAADCDDDFIEKSLMASRQVQHEDVGICESVQVGLGSSAYDTGRYAPMIEMGEYHFHRLLHADLKATEC